ncbi:hypothetical protein P615_13530 [Brevibacillus laterosporus PE36]|nr:hypothetical protein P615_13530 [Brevibacillus laterosporus PE36]
MKIHIGFHEKASLACFFSINMTSYKGEIQ